VSAPGASGVNNFADRVLRNRIDRADEPAAYSIWQGRIMEQLTWGTLASDVADCRNSMLRLGVSPGDRIVAQMATGSAALTAFFAAASIVAVLIPDIIKGRFAAAAASASIARLPSTSAFTRLPSTSVFTWLRTAELWPLLSSALAAVPNEQRHLPSTTASTKYKLPSTPAAATSATTSVNTRSAIISQ